MLASLWLAGSRAHTEASRGIPGLRSGASGPAFPALHSFLDQVLLGQLAAHGIPGAAAAVVKDGALLSVRPLPNLAIHCMSCLAGTACSTRSTP